MNFIKTTMQNICIVVSVCQKSFSGSFAVGKTPPKAVAQRRFQSRNAAL
jgi:hypothetical protein